MMSKNIINNSNNISNNNNTHNTMIIIKNNNNNNNITEHQRSRRLPIVQLLRPLPRTRNRKRRKL